MKLSIKIYKKTIFALSFLVFIVNAISSLADDYPFFSNASLRFKLQGKNEGSEELYIKGNKFRSITRLKTNPAQSVIVVDLISIFEGPYVIIVDLNQKKGIRVPNRFRKPYEQMTIEERKVFKREVLFGIIGEDQYKEIGKEMILDKKCDVIQLEIKNFNMKLWIWKDTVLKSEITGPVIFYKTVISIDTETPISEDIFKIPSEIKIEDKF